MGGWTGGTSVRRSARRLVGRFNCGTQGAGRAARPPGEYWQSSIRCSTSLGAACLLHEEWQSSFTAAGARNAPSWARNEAQQSSFGLDAARRRWFGPGMRLSNPQSARRAVAALHAAARQPPRFTPPRVSRHPWPPRAHAARKQAATTRSGARSSPRSTPVGVRSRRQRYRCRPRERPSSVAPHAARAQANAGIYRASRPARAPGSDRSLRCRATR